MSTQQINVGNPYHVPTTVDNRHVRNLGASHKAWVVTNAGIDDWRFLKRWIAELFVEYYGTHVYAGHPIDGFYMYIIEQAEMYPESKRLFQLRWEDMFDHWVL